MCYKFEVFIFQEVCENKFTIGNSLMSTAVAKNIKEVFIMFEYFYKCFRTWSDQTFKIITDKTYIEKCVKKQKELVSVHCYIITQLSQENNLIKLCTVIYTQSRVISQQNIPLLRHKGNYKQQTQTFLAPHHTKTACPHREKIARAASQFRDYLHNKHAKLLAIMPEINKRSSCAFHVWFRPQSPTSSNSR